LSQIDQRPNLLDLNGYGLSNAGNLWMSKITEGSYPPDHPEQVLKQRPALERRSGRYDPCSR
ncbi:MAG: hypothetical protein WBM72_07120, partial [Actinomycetota bacterium]